jgi:preflagellin peptidase FlaK
MSTTDASTSIDIIRVILAMVFLCYASFTDLKTRKVKNQVWMVMGLLGGIILFIQMLYEEVAWEYYLIFLPIGILFASMFLEHDPLYDSEKKKFNFKIFILYILGILVVIYQIYLLAGETLFYQLLTIPVLIVFFFILYQFGAIHGGADAKALMTLAIFVPFYPHFYGFPLLQFSSDRVAEAMELFFPFAFLILMNSVLFVVWAFLAFFVFNAARKDFGFPEMILGYRMNISEIERKHVWPMERIVNGERVLVLFPKKNDDDSLIALKEEGILRIWVTPKIPFIVFLTAGFIISVFLGNLFIAFIELLG